MENDYIALSTTGLTNNHRFMDMVSTLDKDSKSYSVKHVEERNIDAI